MPQLVAGREERHSGTTSYVDFAGADRGEHTDVGRHQARAGAQRDAAGGDVLAGLPHVLAGSLPGADNCRVAVAQHALLHHDGIGPRRHRRAGHDAHAVTRGHRSRIRSSCRGRANDFEARLAVRCQVGTDDRVTVHRGIRVRRHIDCRSGVGTQDSPQRVAHGQRFGAGDGADVGENARLRIREFQRRAVVSVATAVSSGLATHVRCLVPARVFAPGQRALDCALVLRRIDVGERLGHVAEIHARKAVPGVPTVDLTPSVVEITSQVVQQTAGQ